jgi:hypothetical protein
VAIDRGGNASRLPALNLDDAARESRSVIVLFSYAGDRFVGRVLGALREPATLANGEGEQAAEERDQSDRQGPDDATGPTEQA